MLTLIDALDYLEKNTDMFKPKEEPKPHPQYVGAIPPQSQPQSQPQPQPQPETPPQPQPETPPQPQPQPAPNPNEDEPI